MRSFHLSRFSVQILQILRSWRGEWFTEIFEHVGHLPDVGVAWFKKVHGDGLDVGGSGSWLSR